MYDEARCAPALQGAPPLRIALRVCVCVRVCTWYVREENARGRSGDAYGDVMCGEREAR